MLKKIDTLLERIEQYLVIGIFFALIILMSINIVQRNIFGQSSQTILEFLPNMVMWISLLGASLALRQGQHISMELLLRFVPAQMKQILQRLAATFACLVMLIGFYLAQGFLESELRIFGMKGYLSTIVPIFFATAAFRFMVLAVYPIQHAK